MTAQAIRCGTLFDGTGGEPVAGPTRVNINASLQTELFGFWPGPGPFSRLRHRLSPGINYNYSPVPTVTDRQREVFNLPETRSHLREQNRITLSLNQTFEAKFREDRAPARDTAASTSFDAVPRSVPCTFAVSVIIRCWL